MASKRFLMVPDDSSAARMPRPGATMASATLLSSARFITTSSFALLIHRQFCRRFEPLQRVYRCIGHSSDPKYLDARQRFAFQPFEERAPGGRDVREPFGRASGIERGDRVTAACHRYNLPAAVSSAAASATSIVPMSKGS